MLFARNTILGIHAPPPRLTWSALWLAFRYVGLPLLALALVIDALIALG